MNIPDLHVYHFAPYEPAALKRLMGRYATREDEIDRMLRAGCSWTCTPSSGTASAPASKATRSRSWSRSMGSCATLPLADAGKTMAKVQACLELGDLTASAMRTGRR